MLEYTEQFTDFCEENDVTIAFLPPYSPDYTPIELTFGYIKRYIREHEFENFHKLYDDEGADQMLDIIVRGLERVTPDILINNTLHIMKNWNSTSL